MIAAKTPKTISQTIKAISLFSLSPATCNDSSSFSFRRVEEILEQDALFKRELTYFFGA